MEQQLLNNIYIMKLYLYYIKASKVVLQTDIDKVKRLFSIVYE